MRVIRPLACGAAAALVATALVVAGSPAQAYERPGTYATGTGTSPSGSTAVWTVAVDNPTPTTPQLAATLDTGAVTSPAQGAAPAWQVNWQSPTNNAAGTFDRIGQVTVTFPDGAKTNPVLHLTGMGGSSAGLLSVRYRLLSSVPAGATWTPTAGWTGWTTSANLVTPAAGNTPTATCSTNVASSAGCGSLRINGNVSSVTMQVEVSDQAPGTEDGVRHTVSFGEDGSDAPASYGTATHLLGPGALGTSVTEDFASTLSSSVNAPPGMAQGTDGPQIAGAFPALAQNTTGTYQVTVPLRAPDVASELHAWIDWNRNGVYDLAERSTTGTAVPAGATSATFGWNIPSNAMLSGTTWVRVRLATNGPAAPGSTPPSGYPAGTVASYPTGAGRAGEVEDFTITIAQVAPVIDTPADVIRDSTPVITGVGEPGSTVTVRDAGGQALCTATVQPDGTWSCESTVALPDGTTTVTATQDNGTTVSPTSAPVTLTIDAPPNAPTITAPTGTTGDSTPEITGTGDAGDTIVVRDENGDPVCSATVTAGGTWSCTPDTALSDGAHTLTPTATDPGGNSTAGDPVDVTVDTTPPTAPAITGPADGSTTGDSTPEITGTGDAGDTIVVRDENGDPVCSATVTAEGTWSCTPDAPLSDGAHTLTPTATDAGGNSTPGDPVDVTVDTTPPTAPAITGPEDGSTTGDSTPEITGTGDAGDTIVVTDENGDPVCSATVTAEGTWSCTPDTALPDGAHTLTPTATDAGGNSTPGDPVDVTVDTTPPTAPTITGPEDDSTTGDSTPEITGTGDAGDTIVVTDENGDPVCSATVTAGGTWSCTPDTPLSDGAHTLTPTATDAGGNSTAGDPVDVTVDTTPPTAPTITGPEDDSTTGDSTPEITGTGDAGDTIVVTDENGDPVCSATVTAEGTWSCTPATPLDDGAHTLTPTATDAGGNSTPGDPVDVTVDTVPPTAPAITGPTGTTGDSTPEISGTGDAGDTIVVADENGDPVCSATVTAGGTWSCTPTTPLDDGAHTLTPTATDAGGNSTPGDPVDVTVDTVPPAAPTITGPTGTTGDSTPEITGTGDAGDTVVVTDENGDPVCTATVTAGGTWSCTPVTPLPDGAHTLTPTATDAGGNSTAGDPVDVTVDTVPPTAPAITGPTGTTGDSTPEITGTGDAGDTIVVRDENGDPVCTATVTAGGTWSCTPDTPLPDGAHTLTPTATDAGGNSTPGDPVDVTVDTVPPVAPVITGPTDGSATQDTTPLISGTGEPGSGITVSDEDGGLICMATVAADGTWSCTPLAPLPPGANTLRVTATDAAGNSTEGAAIVVTVVPVTPPPGPGPAGGGSGALPTTGGSAPVGAVEGALLLLLLGAALVRAGRRRLVKSDG